MLLSSSGRILWILALLIVPSQAFLLGLWTGFMGFIFGDSFLFFPRIRCFLALRRLKFDLGDYGRYPKFFRDYSIAEYGQTGAYIGPDEIEEYLRIGDSTSSNFWLEGPYLDFTLQFQGYKDGQCQVLTTSPTTFLTDPAHGATEFRVKTIFVVKVFFDLREKFVSRINAFFPSGFHNLIWSEAYLDSNATRDWICGVYNGICVENGVFSEPLDDCASQLAELAISEGPEGHVDGRTSGCRALHAVMAERDPTSHCPHLSLDPMPDPKDRIKCQTSKFTSPFSLLTDSDVSFFRKFATDNGVDPDVGYTLLPEDA